MAGHSAWKNIKHKKAASDAKKGKLWSKCARAIIVAAKNGGGNPESNLALKCAIDEARAANLPKDTIEKAIKKGTGELGAEDYEAATYEGYGPGGVAMLIEILTNNRNRSASDIRLMMDKGGGKLGALGCVSYMFAPKGQILVSKSAASEDALMSLSLEAGAEDVVDAGESWQVLTAVPDYLKVRKALDDAKIAVESGEITKVPSTTVTLTGEAAEKIVKLIETLEDNDDVQKVHANVDISAEELARLG